MKKPIIICILLLIAVFGAGCVNIEETEPNSTIPPIPPVTYPPNTIEPVVGECEGYDAQNKITYELLCLYDGYAKLEVDNKSGPQEIEFVHRGARTGENPTYQLRLDYGQYILKLSENGKTAELTTPDGANVLMTYESF